MPWFLVWIVLALFLPPSGTDPGADSPPPIPPATDCREAPLSVEALRDRLVRAGVPPHGVRQPADQRVFVAPAGTPLSAAAAAAVVDTVWQSTACHNASGPLGSAPFSTDHDLRQS